MVGSKVAVTAEEADLRVIVGCALKTSAAGSEAIKKQKGFRNGKERKGLSAENIAYHCINQKVLTATCSFGAWLRKDVEELEKLTEVRTLGGQRWEWHPCN